VGEAEQEAAEVGDGAGDAERPRVRVPVLLRGAAEERGEGRLAQQLGAHREALHGPALLPHAHRDVALRHRPRLLPLPPPPPAGGPRRRAAAVLARRRHRAGQPPQEPLHGLVLGWSEEWELGKAVGCSLERARLGELGFGCCGGEWDCEFRAL